MTKPNTMKDLKEFEICYDITARMALFALAKSCSISETKVVFAFISEALSEIYDPEQVARLVAQHQETTLRLNKEFKNASL